MKRPFFATLACAAFAVTLFVLPGAFARAADNNDCNGSAVECTNRSYEAADKELNAVYQKLAEKLDAQAKDLLKLSERAWLAFRDANGALRSGAWNGGFAANPVLFAALGGMTRDRVKLLKQMSGRMEDFPWQEKACEKSTQFPPEYGLCVEKALDQADRELNRAYQAAMAKLPAEGTETLKKAQRAWLEFRDADAGFYADHWRGGTGYGAALTAAKAGLTRARTAELREVAKEN
jgi:uncharacterized protein YecT (DUF1311 family)